MTTRSGVDESVHHGSVVALDERGHELFVAGDPSRPMYPRSALKPLQAEAMLHCGLDVDDQQLALVCASHDGTDRHCEIVRSILEGWGSTSRRSATWRACRSTIAPRRRTSAREPSRHRCG
ncbi:MAG: asparaginase [Ilumatobacteraceae bacterium]